MIPKEMQINVGIYSFVKHHHRSESGGILYAVPGGGRATESDIIAWAKKNKLKPRLESVK